MSWPQECPELGTLPYSFEQHSDKLTTPLHFLFSFPTAREFSFVLSQHINGKLHKPNYNFKKY